jgi:hypothetical protein
MAPYARRAPRSLHRLARTYLRRQHPETDVGQLLRKQLALGGQQLSQAAIEALLLLQPVRHRPLHAHKKRAALGGRWPGVCGGRGGRRHQPGCRAGWQGGTVRGGCVRGGSVPGGSVCRGCSPLMPPQEQELKPHRVQTVPAPNPRHHPP